MTVQVYVNDISRHWLDPLERGFQYGDGLFETMAVRQGELPHWLYHWERLVAGCERLNIPVPDQAALEDKITRLIRQQAKAVVKLIVSRGNSTRGYRIPPKQNPTQVLYLSPWLDYPAHYAEQGIHLKVCRTPLGMNPALAGIKHLNRLEQILARNEWQDEKFQEGVMLNTSGHVIEGTMSNIFWVKAGQLYTPDLTECGVLGITRQRVLEKTKENGMDVRIVRQHIDSLYEADEVFMTNSLFGIWPVQSIEDRQYTAGPITQLLQNLVN
ncbi:MAG: aminodeoxychorismate lyase [Gammaproteobacteria bacterium]|nr:aminodeoxychorismate lyase [Gammaproteobacteria bacterium]MDH5652681.1 aminodeoxychorismate lyase [Gammaproteobacteria bacterium]